MLGILISTYNMYQDLLVSGIYKNNGYLLVSCNGGLNQMRGAICDMVAIARYLNVTLIVPELDKTSFWADPSEFKDIFDVDHFITSLRDEVRILKELSPRLKKRVKLGLFHSFPPISWSDISYYQDQAAATEGQELLGLGIRVDTVGSEMIRGISGGQKKRSEMLVGPSNRLFMDEISTGLDSSTTYQIVNSLHHAVHILQGTALISLLQPVPETYDLFDDIIHLSDGLIVTKVLEKMCLSFLNQWVSSVERGKELQTSCKK